MTPSDPFGSSAPGRTRHPWDPQLPATSAGGTHAPDRWVTTSTRRPLAVLRQSWASGAASRWEMP